MGLRRDVNFSEGNQLTLLQSGAEFFPSLIAAIEQARTEIYLETYIFSHDTTGMLVHDALCRAANRGVFVHVIADWYGTGGQRCNELARSFAIAGVHFRSFNAWFTRGLARTHRKLFIADHDFAIVGGININHDFYVSSRRNAQLDYPRWDFAVSVRGPLVEEIHLLMSEQWQKIGNLDLRLRLKLLVRKTHVNPVGHKPVVAGLAPRDNVLFRSTIHKAYLNAIGNARTRVLIATPYFAPGRKFRHALTNAANRGVRVTLLIGCGDFMLQDAVARSYYRKLLSQGVEIIEYRKSQLHAKVAAIDDEWSTVGSSNCDGFSLLINQEANVVIKDRSFTAQVAMAIMQGIDDSVRIDPADYIEISWYRKFWYGCAFFIYSAVIRLIALEDFM